MGGEWGGILDTRTKGRREAGWDRGVTYRLPPSEFYPGRGSRRTF